MTPEEPTTDRMEDTTATSARGVLVLRGILPADVVRVELTHERLVLGRGSECDVPVARARISRQHAEVCRRGPLVTIRDLGSTNGTWVNGKRVEHGPLSAGDLLRLGDWLGVVEEGLMDDRAVSFAELAPDLWGGRLLSRILEPVKNAAQSRLPILLIGRTGTGKERFAQALHHFAGRGPFHAINCAALPLPMAEGELFGYRKGAFTGADRSYAGQLRAADGGTLFLDEVGDLPLPLQAKLLRALDTGEIAPLGDSGRTRFDAGVVAACQEPLTKLVAEGRFREDLAARLSGITVTLPLLRDRVGDIPSLFALFLQRHSGGTAPPATAKLFEGLCLHDWPGNVRELELLARQLLAVRGLEPVLRRSHLPPAFRGHAKAGSSEADSADDRNERDIEALAAALKTAGGNVKLAAEISGISRQRAYRLIGSRGLGQLLAQSRNGTDGANGQGD
jgi:transcriptional regulator of acetoin/glycerol metabolism